MRTPERLARLERQNLRLRLLLIAGVAGCVWMGQAPPRAAVVDAERVVLRGADGTRAEIFSSGLFFYGSEGELQPTVVLRAGEDGASLWLVRNEHGVELGAGDHESFLRLHAGEGTTPIRLAASADGTARLAIFPARESRHPRVVLGTSENGPGFVRTFDADESVAWEAPRKAESGERLSRPAARSP